VTVAVDPDSPNASTPARTVPDWDGLYDECPEADCEVSEIEGKLPPGLVGTLYRNGPGKRNLATNFFDGDGLIRKLSFLPGGRLHYRSRYVKTPKYLAELHADRPMARTAGTQLPGGVLANAFRMPQSEANTHVTLQGGKLHALHEGGPPVQLDPETLETVGNDDLGGTLPKRTLFGAHPHLEPATGDMYTFGIDPVGRRPRIRTFR
jgi:all-trans-8'-apo-beta-carotenal 15,15'-oxygenase